MRTGRKAYIYIPPNVFTPKWNIDIIDENGITYSVEEYTIDASVNFTLSESLATFTLKLINLDGMWLNKFNGGEVISIYADYTNGTNKIFQGKIVNVFYGLDSNGWIVTLEGKQCPELSDIKINTFFENSEIYDAIEEIILTYVPTIVGYLYISLSTTPITDTYRGISIYQCLVNLVKKINQDIYIDANLQIHTLEEGSVINENERVIFGQNLISVPNFGKDNEKVFNRVSVCGNNDSNILYMSTKEDAASQTDLWRKDYIINDTILATNTEVENRATTELSNLIIQNVASGRVTSLGLPTLKPGDYIQFSVPYCNINGYYKVNSFTHTLSSNGFLTEIELSKKQDTLTRLFRDRISENENNRDYINLFDMENTLVVHFNENPSIITHNTGTTEEVDSVLKLIVGESTGTITTTVINSSKNIVCCMLTTLDNFSKSLDVYEVSNTNGATWETLTLGEVHDFTSTGSQLLFRMTLNSDSLNNPAYDAICLLYSSIRRKSGYT